jgi:hypothetical protein
LLSHSETVGFLDADNCKAAYAEAHKFLTECCAIITKGGGVARVLTQKDWANLRKLQKSRPFRSPCLAEVEDRMVRVWGCFLI